MHSATCAAGSASTTGIDVMRNILIAAAAVLTIGALAPAAQAQTYYQYQTYPSYQVVPRPAPAQQVMNYPDNLTAALTLLQQAEDQLRTVRLRDNDHRNDAIDK